MSTDANRPGPPIDHPRVEWTADELAHDAQAFHRNAHLQDVVDKDVLVKGAMIANAPWNDVAANLNHREEQILLDEFENRRPYWQSRGLMITIMATACAAITQGWQQSTINGSTLFNWEEEFGLKKERDERLIGLINAAPWLSGSLIGTWMSDPLQDRYGRRPALFVAALICIGLVIGTAQCNSWKALLSCRFILGIGIGAKASIAPVFAAEAAPDKHRGKVLMMWQVFDAFGIFLGFVCAFLVRKSWRLLLATAIIPAIALLCVVFMCPESPRFLIQKHRYEEAYKSLLELRGTEIQAARDLYNIHIQLQAEATRLWTPGAQEWSEQSECYAYQGWIRRENFFKRMRHLFTEPRTRRACVAALIVMLSQQLCGINALAFYSSDIIKSAAATANDPNIRIEAYNLGFGLANFVFTFPAYYFIDLKGRRPLLLVSFSGMLLSLAAITGFFKMTDPENRLILVFIFSIAFFVFFYSIGAGPIPFTFSAEAFPLCVRDVGMSFSVMINFLFLGLLVFAVPSLTKNLGRGNSCGSSGTPCDGQANLLALLTGLNFLSLILIFFLVPETYATPLERMNDIFGCRTMQQPHLRSLRQLHRKSSRQSSPANERYELSCELP